MSNTETRLDFDILWKETITLFIEPFVEFFMPDLYPYRKELKILILQI